MGLVLEDDGFEKEMSDNFSTYCKPLIPCMQELRRAVFPGGKRHVREDRGLCVRIADVLKKAKENLSDKLITFRREAFVGLNTTSTA